MKYIAFVAFILTIPAANWMIGNMGTVCPPDSPCLIPVGFGLMAPSGVLMIGAAILLRDVIHSLLGVRWVFAAIVLGVAIAAVIAPPYLVIASVSAFVLSELADTFVYAPLYKKRLIAAVLASGIAGSIVDSVVFLTIAFGSLEYVEGQIIGKMMMTLGAIPVLMLMRAYVLPART